MPLLIFLVILSYFFAVIGVICLIVKTRDTSKQIHFTGEDIAEIKNRLARQDEQIADLRRALQETGLPVSLRPQVPPPQPAWDEHALYTPDAAEVPHEQPLSQTPDAPPRPIAWDDHPLYTLAPSGGMAAETTAPGAPAAPAPPQTGSSAPSLWNSFISFIKGGNLWVAGGVVLLFAAFGLLLTYMARRGFFSVEMRIAAAVLFGSVMLVFGWKFRLRKPVYALVIQGGGIGVLYLSFFAASKLTSLLPAPAALVLITLLIPPTIILALAQNAQALAVFGLFGGFAAPILLSSGGGSHIALFSYYAVLNIGVVIIGRYRLWRVLNLLAGVCTFAMSLAWIAVRYEPALFATVEPFMLGFILVFTFTGIRSARRGAISLENYIDLPIIIGAPFAGALTQWRIFSYIDHGLAIVSLVFSAFYLLLTWIIWKKSGLSIRRLAEGYLGLSVFLANLAIPLELSPQVTSALWAAEGVLIFLYGSRYNSGRIRIAGLILHAAAAIAFVVEQGFWFLNEYVSTSPPAFRSSAFTGGLIIALSALVTAVFAARYKDSAGLRASPPGFHVFLTVWGFIWWFASWGLEFIRTADSPAALLFICASLTALGAYAAGRFFRVPAFGLSILAPALIALYICGGSLFSRLLRLISYRPLSILTFNFFEGPFLWAWLLFFAGQVILLRRTGIAKDIPVKIHALWLGLFLFIGILVLTCTGRAYTVILELSRSWTSLAGILPSLICVAVLSLTAKGFKAADPSYRRCVFVMLPRILCLATTIWFTGVLFSAGSPDPLPLYIPFINPLDLQQAFCIAIIILRHISLRRAGIGASFKNSTIFALADGMAFLWLTALAARSSHYFLGIPLSKVPFSGQFHLILVAVWGLYGIGHILAGHKKSLRNLWLAGAALTVIDITKLLFIDLAQTGTITRIISFFIAGLFLLFIGWAAPLPPVSREKKV